MSDVTKDTLDTHDASMRALVVAAAKLFESALLRYAQALPTDGAAFGTLIADAGAEPFLEVRLTQASPGVTFGVIHLGRRELFYEWPGAVDARKPALLQ